MPTSQSGRGEQRDRTERVLQEPRGAAGVTAVAGFAFVSIFIPWSQSPAVTQAGRQPGRQGPRT